MFDPISRASFGVRDLMRLARNEEPAPSAFPPAGPPPPPRSPVDVEPDTPPAVRSFTCWAPIVEFANHTPSTDSSSLCVARERASLFMSLRGWETKGVLVLCCPLFVCIPCEGVNGDSNCCCCCCCSAARGMSQSRSPIPCNTQHAGGKTETRGQTMELGRIFV